MAALRVLSIAVAKGRAGYVYLSGGELIDWDLSVKAVKSASNMVGFVQELITKLKPDVVVTEKLSALCRKGRKTRKLIASAAELASHNYVLDVSVERPHDYSCKYTEAQALAKRYPELQGRVPKKRRYWDSEPRQTVIFEALAMAEKVINGPPTTLARAMG